MKNRFPLWLRITHWLNVPVLVLMVWSGLLIYWANNIYPIFFPEGFFEHLGLSARLAEGMAIHFAVGWIFVLNGLVYLAGFLLSRHWRELLPTRATFRELLPTLLHDLGLRKEAPPHGLYNAAQRCAYTFVIFVGVIVVASGFAIYKPVQLSHLREMFGGYEAARLVHFLAMLAFVFFVLVHLVQVARAGFCRFQAMVTGVEEAPAPLALKGVIVLSVFFALFTLGWAHLSQESENDEIPTAFRTVHEWNGKLWTSLYNPSRSAVCAAPKNRPPIRENGDIGLNSPLDIGQWKLEISEDGGKPHLLSMKEIKALPRVEKETEFRCIEGWSTPISYAGARMEDLLKTLKVNGTYSYVGFSTPDGGYYVSMEMFALLHPDTLLAYEMNGAPLTNEHGAPLRLVIPIKYGIKSIKRIGKIFLTNSRPPDYWAEQGYDWYSQL